MRVKIKSKRVITTGRPAVMKPLVFTESIQRERAWAFLLSISARNSQSNRFFYNMSGKIKNEESFTEKQYETLVRFLPAEFRPRWGVPEILGMLGD